MKTRLLFRENGSVLRSRNETREWMLGVLAALALVAVLGLAQSWDLEANAELEALAQRERQLLTLKARDAYERGMSDALEALKDTPDGVQLLQACMAQGFRPVDGSQQ